MLKSLFLYGVLGVIVLLIPAQCQQISVCVEDDNDLRVDCRVPPKPNKINSYEFSWSIGTKESLINTNVSGSSAEGQVKGSYVEELEPHGYRMTLPGFIDKLPYNTTYMCQVSGIGDRITVEREQLAPCSAVSMFLKSSCSLIICLLLSFYQAHS
uniref:Ig-like domain-containing protein n=1 Tax=Labrus bergylta TaxID=56723 RepID=A0A3Q3MJP4_9LABR